MVSSPASLRAGPVGSRRVATVGRVSTRKLIVAALLCGVAILVAGTILLVSLSNSDVKTRVDQVPVPTSAPRR